MPGTAATVTPNAPSTPSLPQGRMLAPDEQYAYRLGVEHGREVKEGVVDVEIYDATGIAMQCRNVHARIDYARGGRLMILTLVPRTPKRKAET